MTGKKAVKSRKQAQKPTKDEEVEVRTGVQLLLGNMVGEKDRSYYYDTYLKLLGQKASIGSKIQDFGKKAKEAGVDLAAMKLTIQMEKWDPLDLATHLKQQAAFMRDRGLPVQMSLYEPQYGSIEEQAKKLGWDAGIAGRSPPTDLFPEGTPGNSEMMRGWNDGQAHIIQNGKKKPEPDFQE